MTTDDTASNQWFPDPFAVAQSAAEVPIEAGSYVVDLSTGAVDQGVDLVGETTGSFFAEAFGPVWKMALAVLAVVVIIKVI